ncbi:MAG TPA: nuclear transport factor 2 family protein [Hyphomonadaceae bacterium]|jgi:hypothetical protein|nr:nuclear transport factor 2 family protein [Hyphomonadaceae bacterium]HPN04984.1 nuclear transport factor 2 family protein [Hyphomonadaceae bacterium]
MADHTAENPGQVHLLRANLDRVFNERSSEKRAAAIAELFVDKPVMYEPTNVVEGRAAISAIAGSLLEQFGPTFRFVTEGHAVEHHGFAVQRWTAGPEGGPVAVTGTDAAEIVDGRISKLWVLIDPPQAET